MLVAEDRVFDFLGIAVGFCHLGNPSSVRVYVYLW